MTEHILIVDDEIAIRDMTRMALESEGFTVSDASNAHQAIKLLENNDIQLILLDWMMPGIAGIDLAARLRRENTRPDLGIIMLSARDQEDDMIRGLDVGADDYIKKPFSTREMISRIRAVLRRISDATMQAETITVDRISIDCTQHRVLIDDAEVNLSPTEFRLLYYLMSHAERAFDRNQLLDNVWGNDVYLDDRTVDVHIRRLRKALSRFACDHHITTVRGVGYRFTDKGKTMQ